MGLLGTMAAMEASSEAAKSGARCDERLVMHRVTNGGCYDDFTEAMAKCRSRFRPPAKERYNRQDVAKRLFNDEEVEACFQATAALRKCFAGNPAKFQHQYLRRIDEGLDQDTMPSEYDITRDDAEIFRWWTGMRRN